MPDARVFAPDHQGGRDLENNAELSARETTGGMDFPKSLTNMCPLLRDNRPFAAMRGAAPGGRVYETTAPAIERAPIRDLGRAQPFVGIDRIALYVAGDDAGFTAPP